MLHPNSHQGLRGSVLWPTTEQRHRYNQMQNLCFQSLAFLVIRHRIILPDDDRWKVYRWRRALDMIFGVEEVINIMVPTSSLRYAATAVVTRSSFKLIRRPIRRASRSFANSSGLCLWNRIILFNREIERWEPDSHCACWFDSVFSDSTGRLQG